MTRAPLGSVAVLGWALTPWMAVPLPAVLLGAVGFHVLRPHPALGALAVLCAGLSQTWWLVDAWTLAGKGSPWGVWIGAGLWQATAPLCAVALGAWIKRRSWWNTALIWGTTQAIADLISPLPALHATLVAPQSWALWPAALAGPCLVTAVLAGLGALLVEHPRAGVAGVLVWLGIGGLLPQLPAVGVPLQAAVVQLDLHTLDARPSLADHRQEQILGLVRGLEVDLVALPEGAWPHDPGRPGGARRRTFHEALTGLPPLVMGATVGQSPDATNSMLAVGTETTQFDKTVLVPVWERTFLGFGSHRYQVGEGGLLTWGERQLGVLVCYEDVVGWRVAEAAGGDLLIAATNDSWNGPGAGSRMHLSMARLAAASTGHWVLRPALNGPSAILSPWGAAVWSTPWVERGPGSVGTAQVYTGTSVRPGRWLQIWDLVFLLAGLLLVLERVTARRSP